MSRIGKKPIPLPKGVSYTVEGNVITVKGPKGTVSSHSKKLTNTHRPIQRPVQPSTRRGQDWFRRNNRSTRSRAAVGWPGEAPTRGANHIKPATHRNDH